MHITLDGTIILINYMYMYIYFMNWIVASVNSHTVYYFSLYTLDGHRIIEPSQLDDNGQYVAVGRERQYVF